MKCSWRQAEAIKVLSVHAWLVLQHAFGWSFLILLLEYQYCYVSCMLNLVRNPATFHDNGYIKS